MTSRAMLAMPCHSTNVPLHLQAAGDDQQGPGKGHRVNKTNRTVWTPHQNAVIRAHFESGKVGLPAIAGRTADAVRGHARRLKLNVTYDRQFWKPDEDDAIRGHFESGLSGLPHIPGRLPNAVRQRKAKLQLFEPQSPFPTAIFDASLPPLPLVYDIWTRFRDECSVPASAEIDWEYGVARIPEHFQLEMGACDIDLINRSGKSSTVLLLCCCLPAATCSLPS